MDLRVMHSPESITTMLRVTNQYSSNPYHGQTPPPPSWWQRRSSGAKFGPSVGAGVVALLLIGVVAACTATPRNSADSGNLPAQSSIESLSAAPSTATPAETQPASPLASSPAPSATPTVEIKRVTQAVRIPYTTRHVSDSSLPKGTQKVRTRGVDGVKTLTYQVTLTNGQQTSKTLVSQEVTKQPVAQVVAVGTKSVSKCDPNYTGACVPIASDVDCLGGGGNGPAYVKGPVYVVGTDIYDLDRDGDGIGCDS